MKEKSFLDKAYFLYFIILVLLVVFRLLSSLGVLSFLGESGDYVFTFVVQILVLFGLSVFGFSKLTKKPAQKVLEDYNFKKISLKSGFICVLMGFIVYFLNSYIASFFYYILQLFGYSNAPPISQGGEYSFGMLILNIVFTAVLPAVCEETAHRGMLLSEMRKRDLWKAIIFSSLFFGLLHINVYQFFYASILGVLLALITISSDSTYPAMIVHFMNNALNVFLAYASVNNLFSYKFVSLLFSLSSGNSVLSVIFFLLFIVFLLLSLYILYLELCKEGAKKKLESLQNGFGKFLARKTFFEELERLKNDQPLDEVAGFDISIIKEYMEQNGSKINKNSDKKANFYSKVFFISSLVLSAVTTIFTFIWGMI